jgi:hypothetical protein
MATALLTAHAERPRRAREGGRVGDGDEGAQAIEIDRFL